MTEILFNADLNISKSGKKHIITLSKVVATQIFLYFRPDPWGKIPIFTHMFQMGWFNHQLLVYRTNVSTFEVYLTHPTEWLWLQAVRIIV